MSNILNPLTDTSERLFYLEYKNSDGSYSRLERNSLNNLNGFKRNFDTNEATIGGKLTLDLRLYGSRKLDLIKAWEPSATEKAPTTLNFPRITYTKNLDISYALLMFDFSESFLKNFDENLVYYDANNRTLLDSFQIKIYIGAINQNSFNINNAQISSDYISINSSEERIGILFTDKPDIQQYIADNATISNIKYLIYNYLPKNINLQNEYVPIRLEFFINSEELNKLVEKNLGVELPTNKIEEINQIFDLQKQEFSVEDSGTSSTYKRPVYLNYLNMPITTSEIINNTSESFEVYNNVHSLQFNTMFNYNTVVSNNTKNYDFFKYGKHIYELKPEVIIKDALPNRISFKKDWEGAESSITYFGFYEQRSLNNVFSEILGFMKHIIWLFNEENSESRNLNILRQVYLTKLQKILLNMLFKQPQPTENLINYYKQETIYKDFYGKTYNYTDYSGAELSNLEKLFLNITCRNYLFLIDFLWYLTGANSSKQYENRKFYSYLENHLFANSKYYNLENVPTLNSFTPYEFDTSIEMFNSYLMSIYCLYFVKNYLTFANFNNFNKNLTTFSKYTEFNRRVLFTINENLHTVKIFNPNIVTKESELFLDNKYTEYATFLILLEEMLNSPVQDVNFFEQVIPRASSNYQFWHIIEKDFTLHSTKIGDSRFIMKDTSESNISTMLNNIDIISTMKYGFLDCVTSYTGSVISLKSKIITNL